MINLESSVQYIKGVGPKRAARLKKLNINNIRDLFYFIPRDYEDTSEFVSLRDAILGEKSSHRVEVSGNPTVLRPRGKLTILKVPVNDESGSAHLTWFNQEYLKNGFRIGQKLVINGKANRSGMELQIMNPVWEDAGKINKVGNINPVYPLTEGITNNQIAKILEFLLEEYIYLIEEFIPIELKNKFNLLSIQQALVNIHFPENIKMLEKSQKTLAFQELLTLQLGLFSIKNNNLSNKQATIFKKSIETPELYNFKDSLPFKLTKAQAKVFCEIENDMESDKQMNRLVQGDVGSGKTIVAILAMFKAYLSGYQSVMMAPTEILARQHYEALSELFGKSDLKFELLVGSLKQKEKTRILEDLKEGKIDILVGTHAIIQDGVDFNNLGLAITDEQHRFGVKQREVLGQKGNNPDILVMTATPIPRTLALIIYGDLDISIIDELPPGRKAIETFAVGSDLIDRMNVFIKKQIEEGRQAYIVCPLIEENETMKVISAEELYVEFKDNIFKEYSVGLLHGKMKTEEKDQIMNDFKENKIQILVSTTVIEVGVNVPNSNIMGIYNAERFGLAQLHQLRGRVGRGEHQSYCILINESKSKSSLERMRILQRSNDGFEISEKDLELRGPGEFFGTRQHGIPELKVANLISDIKILKVVQREAREIIREDPKLELDKHKKLKYRIEDMFKDIEK